MLKLRSLASALLLSGALLGTSHCGTTVEGLAVMVTLTDVPAEVEQLIVTVSTGSKGRNRNRPPLTVPPGTSRFAVVLPDGTTATATINVLAMAQDGCLRAFGSGQVQPTGGLRNYDLTLPLIPDTSCLLTVEVNGDGRVDAGGQSCSSTTSSGTPTNTSSPSEATCYMRLSRGLPLNPSAVLGLKSRGGSWGGECSGDIRSATCSFALTQGKKLTVDFTPRECSPDGVCAFPQPTGFRMRTLRSELSGSTSTLQGGGTGLYTYSASTPNFSWQAQSLNLGPTQVAGLAGTVSQPCVIATDGQLSCYNITTMSFSPVTPPNGTFGKLTAGDSSGLLYVTDAGRIGARMGAGTSLSEIYSGTTPLYAVVIGQSSANWAVGQGVILQKTGSAAWTPVPSPTTKSLYALCLSSFSPQTGFAVGEGGVALRLQNNTWSLVETGDGRSLRAVWCSNSGSGAWAVGDGGAIRRFQSGAATQTFSPPSGQSPNFTGVAGDDNGRTVWIAADSETLYALTY